METAIPLLRRRFLLLAAFAAFASVVVLGPAPAIAQDGGGNADWQPTTTRAFVVGVMEFASLPKLPGDSRRDGDLVAVLKQRGVPAANIVHLKDNAATAAAIREQFAKLLSASKAGETLIVYVAAHGRRISGGETALTPYDYDGSNAGTTGWSIQSLFDTIDSSFKGDRAWLLIDASYGGAANVECAKRTDSRVAYACLSSSSSSLPPGKGWTLASCVMDGLAGNGPVDADRNRAVTLGELAEYAASKLAFREEQLGDLTTTGAFATGDWKVANTARRVGQRVGMNVEAESGGKWYKAEIIGVRNRGREAQVHYVGYPDSDDEWLPRNRIRPWEPMQFPNGTAVDVEQGGKWYPSKVLDGRHGLHLIKYDGYEDIWNEWVGPSRIRKRSGDADPQPDPTPDPTPDPDPDPTPDPDPDPVPEPDPEPLPDPADEPGGTEPTRGEISQATYYLAQLEQAVASANGQEIDPQYYVEQVNRRLDKLKESYPESRIVADIDRRMRVAVRAARGTSIEITPEMLTFRKKEGEIIARIRALVEPEWAAFLADVKERGAITEAFPAKNPEEVPLSSIEGQLVVIPGLKFPRNEFQHLGSSYVFLGSEATGFYFVPARGRHFIEAYEAIKRYRVRISPDMPEEWTLVARITGASVMVPQAGEEKTMDAKPGWIVQPLAIHVPGTTAAIVNEDGDMPSATFIGEAEMDAMLAEGFTTRELPANASPEQVVDAWVTAVKEKNHDLYLSLMDPSLKDGDRNLLFLRDAWSRAQRAFGERYAHAAAVETEANQSETVDGVRYETIRLRVRVYDDAGKQARSLMPITLRRAPGGQWMIIKILPF